MSDRDQFAMAALQGWLASARRLPSPGLLARQCYDYADAMLAFRDARIAKETNHNAAPAARASVESVAPQPTTRGDSARTDKAAPRHSEGTGDISEAQIDALQHVVEDRRFDLVDYGHLRSLLVKLRPEWESDRPKPVKDDVSDRSKPIDILADYSEWLSRLPESIGTHSPECHRWHDKCMIIRLAEELKQTREYRDLAESDAAIARLAADSVMKRAETATTEPRNGAISDGPDPDSRVWETQRIPPPHATPPQGSVPGEGSVPDSRKWNEPVAWWLRGTEYDTGCEYEYVSLVKESAEAAAKGGGTVTPLYRAPTLTDEEREAVRAAIGWIESPSPEDESMPDDYLPITATLRKLLERMT